MFLSLYVWLFLNFVRLLSIIELLELLVNFILRFKLSAILVDLRNKLKLIVCQHTVESLVDFNFGDCFGGSNEPGVVRDLLKPLVLWL